MKPTTITTHLVEGESRPVLLKKYSNALYAASWHEQSSERYPVLLNFMTMETMGLTNEVLLAIVLDRLETFEAGSNPCVENSIAIAHLNTALDYLKERTARRIAQNVEGTMEPHE